MRFPGIGIYAAGGCCNDRLRVTGVLSIESESWQRTKTLSPNDKEKWKRNARRKKNANGGKKRKSKWMNLLSPRRHLKLRNLE